MRPYLFIICWLSTSLVLAQANFSATWSFNNTTGGSSNQANIGTGGADLIGVNLSGVAQYVGGANGQAGNVQNWSVSNCNFSEYVAFTVQPLNGQRMTLSSLSFFFERSNSGPQEIRVRSSIDGFGSDLYTSSVSSSYQLANISLSGAYNNLTSPVTFHIHACNLIAQGGTLHLDEVVINGTVTTTPLPVSLLYFRAQPQPDNRVTLNWETTWERDADRFEIQRGRNLTEFGTIGQVAARGTTDNRQLYNFSDEWPDAGITYYRLRQVDRDGTFTYSDIVAAVLDNETPTMMVLPTQTPGTVWVKGRNLAGAQFSVISSTGRAIPVSVTPGADGTFQVCGPLDAGLYIVQVTKHTVRLTQRVLVRE